MWTIHKWIGKIKTTVADYQQKNMDFQMIARTTCFEWPVRVAAYIAFGWIYLFDGKKCSAWQNQWKVVSDVDVEHVEHHSRPKYSRSSIENIIQHTVFVDWLAWTLNKRSDYTSIRCWRNSDVLLQVWIIFASQFDALLHMWKKQEL